MSTALRRALVSLLEADPALDGLLARDPNVDTDRPALFNGFASGAPPVYDCLCYRVESDDPDPRFRPPVGQGRPSVRDVYVAFQPWTQTPDSGPLEAMAERLAALLENQALPTDDGRVFRWEELTRSLDHYDHTLHARFGLIRYRGRWQASS